MASLSKRRWWPYAAVVLAATMWGSIGTSYALLLDRIDTDPLTLVTIRACTATLLLATWLGLCDRSAFAVSRRELPRLTIFGLVTVTLFYPVLIYTFVETSVAVGTLLLYLAPALVTIVAAFTLGETLSRLKGVALLATLGGCWLVVEGYDPANLRANAFGLSLGLIAALCYAAYSLLGKQLLGRLRTSTVLMWHLLVGSVGLLAVKLATTPTAWPNWDAIAIIAGYGGVIATLAPITLYTVGLSGMPSSEASILATWEPVVAIFLAAVVLREPLGAPQWLGAATVGVGLIILATRGRGMARTRVSPAVLPGGQA
ncbi:MAG: EamA family transporter [Chloroflexia bacterium]|nr:EamA family transporter [Chloroflexia bacterium]